MNPRDVDQLRATAETNDLDCCCDEMAEQFELAKDESGLSPLEVKL
ncbi:hypothetical protein [Pseudomonas veronii]|nr:hypothetical protein [Pseudomonas veronii]